MSETKAGARAVADLVDGCVIALVEIAAPPERVFQALSSPEIVHWWVNPASSTRGNGQAMSVSADAGAPPARGGASPTRSRASFLRSTRHASWSILGMGSARQARTRR